MAFIIKILVTAIALFITAQILNGVKIKSFGTSILAALVLTLLNMVLNPVLQILALPVTILTLGLFAWVINAAMIYITSKLLDGFEITHFGWALLFGFVMALVKSFLFWLF